MKKKLSFLTGLAIVLAVFFVVSPAFAQIADGTYEVPFEMKEKNSENTSIANGYFQSPASVTIQNGVATVTITVTGSQYVVELPGSTTISEDEANQTRTVQYTVNDLTQPVSMEMTIDVPDLYDQTHTARAVFNTSDLPTASEASTSATDDSVTDETAAAGAEVVENPKTGENSPVMLYAGLMLAAVAGFVVVWKIRPARN